jgi:hypothetical protein
MNLICIVIASISGEFVLNNNLCTNNNVGMIMCVWIQIVSQSIFQQDGGGCLGKAPGSGPMAANNHPRTSKESCDSRFQYISCTENCEPFSESLKSFHHGPPSINYRP